MVSKQKYGLILVSCAHFLYPRVGESGVWCFVVYSAYCEEVGAICCTYCAYSLYLRVGEVVGNVLWSSTPHGLRLCEEVGTILLLYRMFELKRVL